MNRICSGVFLVLAVIVAALPAWSADGDFAARLRGDYAFVQTRVCSQGTPGAPGINDNLVLLSPNSLRTTGLRGLMSFDGAGGGAFQSEELQLNAAVTAPGQPQTGRSLGTCDLAYTVDADGHVTITLTACSAVGTLGGVAGMHFTSSDIFVDGQLSSDDKTLLLSDVAGPVSTVTTVETGLVTVRVCSRTGTAVRVR